MVGAIRRISWIIQGGPLAARSSRELRHEALNYRTFSTTSLSSSTSQQISHSGFRARGSRTLERIAMGLPTTRIGTLCAIGISTSSLLGNGQPAPTVPDDYGKSVLSYGIDYFFCGGG
jgi:hypothetical protein